VCSELEAAGKAKFGWVMRQINICWRLILRG